MEKLFTREQARKFLAENNLKDADSIGDALVAQFKDLIQEALEAEMNHKLGYSKYDWKNKEGENSRNGHTKKTIKSKFGEMEIATPRDTNGEFEPVIVKKHERVVSHSVEDMKLIYTAPNEEAGLEALDRFEEIWGKKYAYAVKSWRANWKSLSTFFRYPSEIRKIIYTTNPIEGFNRILRKATKNKSSFPTDDSLFKLLYLVVMDSTEKWQSVRDWSQIINQLSVYFGERVTKHL